MRGLAARVTPLTARPREPGPTLPARRYSVLRRLAVLRRAAAEAAAAGVTGRHLAAAVDVRGANVTVAESLLVAALAGMGNVLLTWVAGPECGRSGCRD